MNITPLQDSFNRGELSPKLYRRTDQEYYLDGVKTMQNYIPVPRGAAKRRTGFRYLGEVGIPSNVLNAFPQTETLTITSPAVDVTFA